MSVPATESTIMLRLLVWIEHKPSASQRSDANCRKKHGSIDVNTSAITQKNHSYSIPLRWFSKHKLTTLHLGSVLGSEFKRDVEALLFSAKRRVRDGEGELSIAIARFD